MKFKSLLAILFCLIAWFNLQAQPVTFRLMHGFTGPDGAYPSCSLTLAGNILYGTTQFGATPGNGYGTIFSVHTDGSGYTNIYNFYGATNGAYPGGVILSSNTLYGTAYQGGTLGFGTIFKLSLTSTNLAVLYNFVYGTNGAHPNANLVLSSNALYGTTFDTSADPSGVFGSGTIFKINENGLGFTNLYRFSDVMLSGSIYTNADGENPATGLILSGSTLYGTTEFGGDSGSGGIFRINTDGSGFTNLYNFTAVDPDLTTNSEGANPTGTLVLIGNTLYGTASAGGTAGVGTVFRTSTNGSNFTNLYNFNGINDEANPAGGLILSGDTFYGTTQFGGTSGNGAVFSLQTDGSGFTNLYSFSQINGAINSDGAQPLNSLILANNTLYGTASQGGNAGNGGEGTVFALSLPAPPSLNIMPTNGNLVISWPISAVNYALEFSTNLANGNWSIINTGIGTNVSNYFYTNQILGNTAFFRLQSQ
jgi:uncharacterized repeat protein (TIGR03803 family)